MNIRVVRLRTHQTNIDRYEGMLNTKLTDAEKRFVEKRLSEERLAIAMLQFTGRPQAPQRTILSPKRRSRSGSPRPACLDFHFIRSAAGPAIENETEAHYR